MDSSPKHDAILRKCSYAWGLGRHFYYLTSLERNQAMKWDFNSQYLGKLKVVFVLHAPADARLSDHSSNVVADWHDAISISVLCGQQQADATYTHLLHGSAGSSEYLHYPSDRRTVWTTPVSYSQSTDMPFAEPSDMNQSNRVTYFHYMWNQLPADGSVVCQSPSVQATIGFVQGGL